MHDFSLGEFVLLPEKFAPKGVCLIWSKVELLPQGVPAERVAVVTENEQDTNIGVSMLWFRHPDEALDGDFEDQTVDREEVEPLCVSSVECPSCGNDWPSFAHTDGTPVEGGRCPFCCHQLT